MSSVTVDTRELDALIGRLEDARPEAALAMARGTGAESQKLVPVSDPALPGSGNLRDSMEIQSRPDGTAAVVYTADHAAVVHNTHLSYYRGQAQYLRQPAVNAKRRLEEAATVIREAITG